MLIIDSFYSPLKNKYAEQKQEALNSVYLANTVKTWKANL